MVKVETREQGGEETPTHSCLPLACLRGSGKARKKRNRQVTTDNADVHNNNNGGLEGKYRVAAPELMQDTFMSDSEDEGGEVECPLQQQQQYRYMHAETSTLQRARPLEDSVTDGHRWPSNNDAAPERPARTDRGFLVSFVVDARGGAMKALRRGGARVVVPPSACAAPTRVTCRAVTRRTPAAAPPPLMEGEALACRLLELQPQGAKFLAPVLIEVPIFSTPCREREIVILRSDTGETWQDHYLHVADNPLVQDALAQERLREGEGEDGRERVTRIVTCDFPHYLAVVTRIRQDVHIIGAEGGTISSSAIPQVQALFPPNALTKRIRVGLQAHAAPAELTRRVLPRAVAVSPVLTVEPRRRKFHRTITLTMPLPQASDGAVSGATPATSGSLRLLCSIMGGQARAVWEDVTGSTPLSVTDGTASFTTTVSARFWLMDCRNVGDATKLATELYREMLLVSFEARLVVLAQRLDALEGRLLVLYLTDRATCDALLQQPHYTEVAQSTAVRLRDSTSVHLEFSGNLVPVTKSGEQPALRFEAFKDNRVEFAVRLKRHDEPPTGRVYFMNEPKVARGQQSQTPVCVLDVSLPSSVTPRAAKSQQDCLNLDQSGFDALHDELGSHWDSSLLSGGGTAPRATPVPPHLTNGHAKAVSNGDVKREEESYPTPAAGGKATFDSDEERTPGNTLEKNKAAKTTPPPDPTPTPPPTPQTAADDRIIDEQLLNKVEDMFKDLKTLPQGELADIAEEPEQQNKQKQLKQQQSQEYNEVDRALRVGADYMGQVVKDNFTKMNAQASSNLLDAETTNRLANTLTDNSRKAEQDINKTLAQAEIQASETLNDVKHLTHNAVGDFKHSEGKVVADTERTTTEALHDVKQATANALHDTKDSTKAAKDSIAEEAWTLISSVEHAADKTLNDANEKFNELALCVDEKVNDAKQTTADTVNDAKQTTAEKINDAKQAVSDTVDDFKHDAADKLNTVHRTATKVSNDFRQDAADVWDDVTDDVERVKNNMADDITLGLEGVTSRASEMTKEAGNTAVHFTNNTQELGGGVEREAQRLVEDVLCEAADACGARTDPFARALNSIGSDVFAPHSTGLMGAGLGSADLLQAERAAAPDAPPATNHSKKGSGIPKLKKKK